MYAPNPAFTDEDKGLSAALGQRQMRLATMRPWQRAAFWLALAHLGAVALLLILARYVRQPAIVVSADSQPIHVVDSVAIYSTVSLVVIWSFVLTGALLAGWRIRLLVLALYTLVVGLQLVLTPPPPTLTPLRPAQLGVLGALWLFGGVALPLVRRRRAMDGGSTPRSATWLTGWMFVAVLLLVSADTIIDVVATAQLGNGQWASALAYVLGARADLLSFALFVVVVITGTDFAELGQALGASAVRLTRAGATQRIRGWLVHPLLILLALALAAASGYTAWSLTGDLWRQADHIWWLYGIALLFFPVPFSALMLWLASRGRQERPADMRVPLAAYIVVAVVLEVALTLLGSGAGPEKIISVVLLIGMAVAGLWLTLASAARNPRWGLAGLLLLAAAFITLVGLPNLQALCAFATPIVIMFYLVPRARTAWANSVLQELVLLQAGLLVVAGMYKLYTLTNALGNQFAPFAALALVVAVLWDLLASGQFTNTESVRLPRSARLLLYFGYSMLIATTALYYGTQFYADTGRPAPTAFNSSLDATLGLLVLGIPLLVVSFAVRVFQQHPATT